MKHKFALCVMAALISVSLVGCGENSVDFGGTAIIKLPNGDIVEGEIQSITRWSASVTEVMIDGTTYTVHPLNLAVIEKGATDERN